MIKRIKKIFFCMFCLGILAGSAALAEEKEKISKEEAIKIAMDSLAQDNVRVKRILERDMKVSVIESFGIHEIFTKLKGKSYWQVAFTPKKQLDSGGMIVFVDIQTGKILDTTPTQFPTR